MAAAEHDDRRKIARRSARIAGALPAAPWRARSLIRRRPRCRSRSAFPASSSTTGTTRRSPGSANWSRAPGRCASISTPASNAAPAPTSAIISSAPATRRTCRSRARTSCARSIAATSPLPESTFPGWSARRTSPKRCSTTGTPISISARSAAAARCSAPTASTRPKSPWPRATSWTRSASARNTPTRSSARCSRSATTSACRRRR